MHYNSFAPHSYKIGLIKTLFYRATRICSPEVLPREKEFLRHTLSLSGYPERIIDKFSRLRPREPQIGARTDDSTLELESELEAETHFVLRSISPQLLQQSIRKLQQR